MSEEFDERVHSSPSDSQSDILSGFNIALLVVVLGQVAIIRVLMLIIATSFADLKEKEVELEAKAQALKVEMEARQLAETDLAASKQKRAELARLEAAAKQKAAQTLAAMTELANQDLSDGDIEALAEAPKLRKELKECQASSKELRQQIIKMSAELAAAQADAAKAERQAEESQRQAKKAEKALKECNQAQGGDPGGKMVNAGMKIYTFPGGKAYLVDAAEDQDPGRLCAAVEYMCTTKSDAPQLCKGSGGEGRPGGSVGR